MSGYVIIGNSVAAVGCIEGIRKTDCKTPITVVSAENHHVYARPLISYLLQGRTGTERMKYRAESFYRDNNVTLILGATVTAVDAKAKKITTDSGKTIDYTKLLVATGSRPFTPPMTGLDSIEYHTFLTLDSALAIQDELAPDARVLIIGAGLIGMKCAEGIAERVKSVTIVEMAPRVLPAVLDENASAIVQAHVEAAPNTGINFKLGDSVDEFIPSAAGKKSKNGKPFGGKARLKSGTELEFDLLIAAVGVRPNTNLVSDAGGKTDKGIIVDAACRTSIPDVYAAGDCVESDDSSIGARRILAILPNAYMQGEVAGINMAGGANATLNDIFPINAAGFFGLHVVTAGSYVGAPVDSPNKQSPYRRFFTEDASGSSLLKGFIIIGDTARTGIYTALIRDKTPLSDIDFDAIVKTPALMAFSKQKRDEILSKGASA